MNTPVISALIATLFTWFITAIGAGTVIFFKSTNEKIMNVMLGFAAGVMIAASFWSLLEPATVSASEYLTTPPYLVVGIGFSLGALFMWASDKAVGLAQEHLHHGTLKNSRVNRIILLVLSITLHNIPEGLAVGVAFGNVANSINAPEAFVGAITIAVGIGLQNFPEGAAVSLPLRKEGFSRFKSFLIGESSAIVEPIFGVIGAASVVYVKYLLPYALSFAAGAMIVVAVHELIPECQKNRNANPYTATFGIVSGFVVMMLLDVALG